MSFDTVSWAIAQRDLTPGEKVVLITLASHRNRKTNQCNPSQKTLSRECGQSVSTINRHLRNLVERNLIRRVRQCDPKTNATKSTRYYFPAAT